jgi:pteridine reductase
MAMELRGRKALVTGAAVRVGREIALELARGGAAIYLHYHASADAARRTAEEIRALGVAVVLVPGDLRDAAETARIAAACTDADILVNSAAVFPATPLPAVTAEDIDGVLALNLRAPFLLARTLGLAMKARGGGAIVNISDVAARRPFSAHLPYSMAKAGLEAMTAGLARLLAPEVRVNAVAPGPVLLPEGLGPKERDAILRHVPLGRAGGPGDVAKAVRFLVEGAEYTTGAVFPVDGGRLLGR